MQNGKILTVNTPSGISNDFGKQLWTIHNEKMYLLLQMLEKNNSVETSRAFGSYVHVTMKEDNISEEQIKNMLLQNGFENSEVKKVEANIEDCFMRLMKN